MSDLNIKNASRVAVISWNNGASAKAISEALSNGKLLRKDSSPLPRSVRTVINFGCKQVDRTMTPTHVASGVRYLNPSPLVQVAGSKVQTFQQIGSLAPPNWTDPLEAVYHSVQGGFDIVCRTVDAGHSGSGIVIVTQEELQAQGNLPRASVYVKAIKKRREYRVHVGKTTSGTAIIDIARKVRRAGVPDGGVNGEGRPFIWNHGNDFIFQRSGVDLQEPCVQRVLSVARRAVIALDLDFGAVDVIVEAGGRIEDSRAYVLEVNTAPGMEGTTLERYIQFFKHRINFERFTPFQDVQGEEYQNGGVDES